MPRETMSERNSNPFYFESIQCEKCGSIENLRLHKHSGDVACVICVNVAMAEAAREDEESNVIGRIYDEDRASENRLEFLLQEREA